MRRPTSVFWLCTHHGLRHPGRGLSIHSRATYTCLCRTLISRQLSMLAICTHHGLRHPGRGLSIHSRATYTCLCRTLISRQLSMLALRAGVTCLVAVAHPQGGERYFLVSHPRSHDSFTAGLAGWSHLPELQWHTLKVVGVTCWFRALVLVSLSLCWRSGCCHMLSGCDPHPPWVACVTFWFRTLPLVPRQPSMLALRAAVTRLSGCDPHPQGGVRYFLVSHPRASGQPSDWLCASSSLRPPA
jgi:hypothetical protein